MAIETIPGRRRFPFTAEQTVNIFGEIGPLVAMFLVNGIHGIAAQWADATTSFRVVSLWFRRRRSCRIAGASASVFGL